PAGGCRRRARGARGGAAGAPRRAGAGARALPLRAPPRRASGRARAGAGGRALLAQGRSRSRPRPDPALDSPGMRRLADPVHRHRALAFVADALLAAAAFALAFQLRFLDVAGGMPARYQTMLAG